MGIDEILKEKREEILRIAARHDTFNVRVFGSVARGDAGPRSDVDFLVEKGSEHDPWWPAGLILDLEDLLGRKVDVVEPEALHWRIKERVLSEAVPL